MSTFLREYGVGALFIIPLIEDGDADFVNDYVPAGGDATVWTDKLISTTLTSLILGFDSLSELPADGATIDEQGAGTASGVVEKTVVISGTVGGGDAAGFFLMRSVTGQAWSNNDVIDINGGSTSIADADSTTYDLAATAGLIGDMGNGRYAIALSPTEMTCAQGSIHIVDSATKTVEDQAILFETYGNASALHAQNLNQTLEAGADAALVTRKLDHLVAVAESDDPVNDSILAKMASTDGDWSNFVEGTDALQAIRDRGDAAWVTATGCALASVLGALDDSAAAGDVTTSDTLMQYLKQLLNEISGSVGIGAMPTAADPANGINLFEMLRAAMGATFGTATDSLEQLQIDIVQVQSDTDDLQTQIGTAGAGLSDLGGMSTGMKAEVEAEVDDGLIAKRLDHLAFVSVTGTDIADNSIFARLVSKEATADWDDFVNTTESLQALRDHIADGTNLTEAGGDGDHLTAIPATVDWLDGGRLDLLLDAIKVPTDKLVFTVANQVDANMVAISDDATAAIVCSVAEAVSLMPNGNVPAMSIKPIASIPAAIITSVREKPLFRNLANIQSTIYSLFTIHYLIILPV